MTEVMAGGRLKRLLQYCYLAAALIYAAVVFYWGRHDMARIHREYRLVSTRLAGDYTMVTAGREVAAGCRQAVGGVDGAGYVDCLRESEPLVTRRAAAIGQELRSEKGQVVKKLLIFYALLLLVLILLPIVFVYVVLATLVHICTGIRFDKDHPD